MNETRKPKWSPWEKVKLEGIDFVDIVYEKKYHLELGGGVARISFNRPQRYNAVSDRMFEETPEAFYDASHDRMIGAIVLTGIGDHIGTGGDVALENRPGVRGGGTKQAFYLATGAINDRLVRMCQKPVIAAVKGFCIGGTHHLVAACDIVIAADTAIMAQNGPRVSSPMDGFAHPHLVRVVGDHKAREVWFLCRRYSASEALEMGLVNKVVRLERLEEEVDYWCEQILSLSPGAIEVIKASYDWETDHFPAQGIMLNMIYPNWFDSPEGKEGGQAFVEKRQPNWWKIRKAEVEQQKNWR